MCAKRTYRRVITRQAQWVERWISSTTPTPPPQQREEHTLLDMKVLAKVEYHQAVDAAYAGRDPRGRPPNVPRKRAREGICGEYDASGTFRKCGSEHLSARSPIFCVQCKRYFHLSCALKSHGLYLRT
jgi:hypothetical protein